MTVFTDTALEAVETIGSGEFVWCHSMAATPTVLLNALALHAASLSDVTLMQLHLEHAESVADPALDGKLRNRCFFAGAATRALINQGRADYVPMFLSEIPKLFRRGEQRLDTALVQVSAPHQHGNCSLGISVEATAAACEMAGKIIAHVNPNMPRTHGDSFINLRDIDCAYMEDTSLITLEPRELRRVDRQIGEKVASLINDGDCLQMGIGAIPDAALGFMRDRKDLGVHTEMFSDGVLTLLEAGVINNARKKVARGRVVTGFV
ncbi:MAG: 4-hydroxybutyrate CoA-transferase, partial [Halioglobus sp.]|nr:4-hydroxybutyrate CoA-transferase [Halioglobus sp.]